MAEYVRKTARYEGKKFEAYGKTELEAMTKLAEKLAAAKRGEGLISGNMTVNAWYAQWMELYKKPKNLTEKSLKVYDEKYNNHIRPYIGNQKIKDVKEAHLQRIMNQQSGKSDSHAKKVRMVLQEIFRRARINRIIVSDPSEFLELPNTSKGRRRSVTEEERSAILEVAKGHPAGLWISTLLYTGMRPGESATLTWADVDFDSDEIRIHTAKESGSRNIKDPKTKAGIRTLPHIPDAIRPGLLEAAKGKKKFDLVFPTSTGTMMNDSAMRRRWLSFKKSIEEHTGEEVADDLVPYCLRHTFATDCAKAGVPVDTVRWLMGHEDISLTANIYQDADKTALRNGLLVLDGGKPGGNPKSETA
jgi:integrase